MERREGSIDFAGRMGRECIAVRVRLINRVITALYDEALRPFGLRISQANILAVVAHHRDWTRPVNISRLLRVEKSTLSRDLDIMRRNGWIESDPPTGGRNRKIRLTSEGGRLFETIRSPWEKAQGEAKVLIGETAEAAIHRLASRLGFEIPAP